jgi:hypothetical protein
MRSEQQSGEWCQRDLETMVEKQSVCIHVDGLNKLLMLVERQEDATVQAPAPIPVTTPSDRPRASLVS